MAQGYMVFVTEINHIFEFESSSIVCYDFSGTTKSGQDMGFKKLDNDRVISIPGRYNFYPFGEEVGVYEDTLMLSWGGWVNFPNEV